MYKNKTISLVIPCLNEEKGIHQVISRIPPCIDATIVVDNGSTDHTAAIASSLGAQVISETKKGYGRAYRTGFEYCRTDIIVTADGDGTYPVEFASAIPTSLGCGREARAPVEGLGSFAAFVRVQADRDGTPRRDREMPGTACRGPADRLRSQLERSRRGGYLQQLRDVSHDGFGPHTATPVASQTTKRKPIPCPSDA